MIELILFVLVLLLGILYEYIIYTKNRTPPKPEKHYVWRTIYPDYKGDWNRGNVTQVYCEQDTNIIRGKVVKQSDGLYLATMWNGQYKECIYEHDAIKSVEEYKPRVNK